MSSLAVLDKTVCLMLRVSRWTGRSRLRAEDLGEAAQKLPPEDLASLGSLKLCDPKRLARIAAIQRAAERDCARVCVRFLGGYATEASKIAALVAKLTEYRARFEAEVKALAEGLQAVIDDWTAMHPKWKSLIDEKTPDAADVLSRHQFRFQAFRIGPADKEGADGVNAGLAEAADGLSGQLFKEIETEARSAWESSYEGKAAVGQKALRPLKAILRKLEALSYLDPRCAPIIDQFRTVLGSLPKHGPIEDPHLSAVIGLFRIVETRDTLRSHGAALLESRSAPHMSADLFADDEALDSSDAAHGDGSDASGAGDDVEEAVEGATPMPPAPPAHEKGSGIWF